MSPIFPSWLVLLTFLVTCEGQLFADDQNQPRGLELTGVLGNLNKVGESILSAGDNKSPLKTILPLVGMDVKTTKTKPTEGPSSSPGPFNELGKNIDNLGEKIIESTKLAETPIRMLNRMIAGATEVSATGTKTVSALTKTADGIARVAETSSKLVTPSEQPPAPSKEHDDPYNYEFLEPNEPFLHRKPKYFSRECHFRVACEAGKLLRPFTEKVTKEVETNRFLQDLSNRYTRAFNYGSIEGNCDRYYCAFLALMSGPAGMASGMAEIVNRVANPDMYEGLSSTN